MHSSLYKNHTGFRVKCADCHVPKPLGPKLWRKLMASRELYHKAMGTIDTPEKFEARRIVLARSEWRRLEESDSRECRNCHSYEAMTIDTQPGDASFWHSKAMDEDYTYTCIDCHKGFVHRLPDMAGEIKKAEEYFRTILAADTLTGDQLYTVMGVSLYSGSKVDDTIIAELELGTPITVLERNDDRLRIRIQGRQYQANKHTLYSMGNQMLVLLRTHGIPLTISGDTIRDEATGLYWQYAEMEGWISREGLSSDITSLWDYGEAIYQNGCIRCHVVFSPSDFWATQWRDYVRNMRCKTNFSPEQVNILLKYLEYHAKPQGVI